jgi:hypothetical protein
MCEEAKQHKAAEMENTLGPLPRPSWQEAERMRAQQETRHPLEIHCKRLNEAFVYLRQSIRTQLHRHGVPSNPGWSDQEIIDSVSDKLGQYVRQLEAAEATNVRLAQERDAVQNRLLQRDPLVSADFAAEGEMTDRQAISALREEHIAYRERVYQWIHNLERQIGEKETGLTNAWREAVAKEVSSHAGMLEELRIACEGMPQIRRRADEDRDNHEMQLNHINEKLASLVFQVDRLEGLTAVPQEVKMMGLEPIQRELERIDKRLAETIGTVTADAGFVHEHQRRIASLEELFTGLDQRFEKSGPLHATSIRAVNERINAHDDCMTALRQWQANIDTALKGLAEMMQSTIEMRHVHEPQTLEQVIEWRHTHGVADCTKSL